MQTNKVTKSIIVHPVTSHGRSEMQKTQSEGASIKGKMRGVSAREPFRELMTHVTAPGNVRYAQGTVGGIDGWWCEPASAINNAVILYVHGGWFNLGTAESYCHLVGQIASKAKAKAFIPDYRLAPEHPFPAALDDVTAAYSALSKNGDQIALAGDSAGGNLSLVVSQTAIKASTEHRIVAVASLSPVTDLAMTGASWETRAKVEPFFVRDQVEELISSYLNGHDPLDPKASPLYGNFDGLPPIQVHVGDNEVLLDDSLRLVDHATKAGVNAKAHVWEGMAHVFQTGIGHLDAAEESLQVIGTFLAEQFALSAKQAFQP